MRTAQTFQHTPEGKAVAEQQGLFIGIPQAAELYQCSERTIRREIAAGRLPVYRFGRTRTLRLKTADVLALIEQVD